MINIIHAILFYKPWSDLVGMQWYRREFEGCWIQIRSEYYGGMPPHRCQWVGWIHGRDEGHCNTIAHTSPRNAGLVHMVQWKKLQCEKY